MASTLTVWVFDGSAAGDQKIRHADGVRLASRGQDAEHAQDALPTDGAGNISFMRIPDGLYTLYVDIPGWEHWQQDLQLPLTGDQEHVEDGRVNVELVRVHQGPGPTPPPELGGLAGQHGRLQAGTEPIFRVAGAPWQWLACDLFAGPLLDAAGEDLTPVFNWVIKTGFVKVRAFGSLHYIAQQMGRQPFLATMDQLERFFQKTTARELRVELTWGDLQILCPTLDDQRRKIYGPLGELLQAFELVTAETLNEGFKNGGFAEEIGALGHGIIQASGNYAPPCNPRLNYGTNHPPRDDEWPRKGGKESYDLYMGFEGLEGGVRIPWVNDEGKGAGEENSDSRSNVANDFFDDAAVSCLLGAGVTHHGTDLVYARIPGPRQQLCAEACVAGARAIPADAALGSYTRGLLSDCPLEHDDARALRTFARISGSKAIAVVVRPLDDERVARNGWRIVGTRGPNGRVVDLAR